MLTYDFVFVRDSRVRITEKDLSQISPDSVYAYKAVVEKISTVLEQIKQDLNKN